MWVIDDLRKRLRENRLSHNSNEKQVSDGSNIKLDRYLDIADGLVMPTYDELTRIAKYFNVSVEYLMFEDENSIELEVIANAGDSFLLNKNILAKKRIDKNLLDGQKPENFFLFKINDELMEPGFKLNDYALLEKCRNIPGESTGLIIDTNNKVAIRNLIETDEMIISFATSSEYSNMTYFYNKDELKHYGKAFKMITLKNIDH
ncbi:helix-turn-helix domain-containing protein [Mycoplasma sp. P36-A1]|uniref:helix-turn-helix domain-containing protein n=1 Tax=Mycoplasma sp. P36-A1 TaxID=3252900 RepID=UPI003C2E8CB5